MTVPATAVVRSGQLTSVFAVEGDGRGCGSSASAPDHGDRVEVLAGLEPGDRVVAQVTPALTDGVRIGGAR